MSASPVMSYDPLPPVDSVAGYERPKRYFFSCFVSRFNQLLVEIRCLRKNGSNLTNRSWKKLRSIQFYLRIASAQCWIISLVDNFFPFFFSHQLRLIGPAVTFIDCNSFLFGKPLCTMLEYRRKSIHVQQYFFQFPINPTHNYWLLNSKRGKIYVTSNHLASLIFEKIAPTQLLMSFNCIN